MPKNPSRTHVVTRTGPKGAVYCAQWGFVGAATIESTSRACAAGEDPTPRRMPAACFLA